MPARSATPIAFSFSSGAGSWNVVPMTSLCSYSARAFQALGARNRGHHGGEVGELVGLKGDKLIARLRGLQRARRGLARRHQSVDLHAGAIEIANDAGLHAHGVLETCEGVLPAHLGIGEQLRRGSRG